METLNVRLKGLYTHPNPLSEAPAGALLVAKNVNVDKEGIVEIRRGLKKYGTELTLAVGETINKLFSFKDVLLVHYASKLARDSDGAGTWSDYSGSYAAPSGAGKIRSIEANKNFYFTTDGGIKKLSDPTGSITQAGGIKALDATATATGGSGFLATANQVAYRIVWGIKDANENLILGAPSQRIIGINTSGGSRDMALVITVPASATTSHFFQIYRSVASGGAAIVPNDELGLVYEANPTAGEIAALSISLTDSTPESLRGATLYTSPSQQGILQANDAPPLCKDMTYYKNLTLYANTVTKQRITLTVISIGGSLGLANDDTITIGGVVFTGKATETASAGQFKVSTGGTPAENIDATAQSLVRVINQYATNTTFYAYYLSGIDDLPGKILIEERSIGGASMALVSSKGTAFNPALPTSGTSISTSNETKTNRIYVSKPLQPEAVPLLNRIDVGSANKDILRIIALRDSVLIFKEDGVFRITGETFDTFNVAIFDATVVLKAAETAVAFNNQIFAYTSQGVVAVSDTGSAIMSRPVEKDMLPIATYTNFDTLSFGVGYDSDRKYFLFVQSASSSTYPKQAFVYNALTNAWTKWSMNRSCGIVNPADDRLYLGAADSGYIYQERKAFGIADYADEEIAVTIAGLSGTTVTLASTAGIEKKDSLVQGTRKSAVLSITDGTTLEVEDSLEWENGSATIYRPIPVELETIQQTGENPGVLKHFREITLFFLKTSFKLINLGVKSNLSSFIDTVGLVPFFYTPGSAAWGRFPWGSGEWGKGVDELQVLRTYIPRDKQRSHWISINIRHQIARDFFAVAGFSLQFSQMSERVR